MKIYSKLDTIPRGSAPDTITPGCIILEGGGFRSVYTGGVLDALMQKGINFETTIGVSGGAMYGFCYVAGQIGKASRVNLHYRHDPNYVGLGAELHRHAILDCDYAFNDLSRDEPLDEKRFYDPRRRFICAATDIWTGKPHYFEKGKCEDIFLAIRASSTIQYVSQPVAIDGRRYLDGACSDHIPLKWALEQGFRKIVIVRTRDRSYRRPDKPLSVWAKMLYHRYPCLLHSLATDAPQYNHLLDEIDKLENEGRILVIAPAEPLTIGKLEPDMEKLGDLYWEGYRDGELAVEKIQQYLR